jgi:2-C-methyl-D-erythritol 4-phosphate cytidylyltransferase
LLAAGKSSRFKDREKKPFANLGGRALWLRSFELFAVRDEVAQILIAVSPDDQELFDRRYRANVAFVPNAKIINGGAERHDSVRNALAHVASDIDLVAIHDAARPCLTSGMIDAVFGRAGETGAAILAAPIYDTIKRGDDKKLIAETVSRSGLWAAQTPQVFRRQTLIDAYARLARGESVTDDAQLVEALGVKIALVECDPSNLKVTTKNDLLLAEAILKGRPQPKENRPFHPFAEEEMWK